MKPLGSIVVCAMCLYVVRSYRQLSGRLAEVEGLQATTQSQVLMDVNVFAPFQVCVDVSNLLQLLSAEASIAQLGAQLAASAATLQSDMARDTARETARDSVEHQLRVELAAALTVASAREAELADARASMVMVEARDVAREAAERDAHAARETQSTLMAELQVGTYPVSVLVCFVMCSLFLDEACLCFAAGT